MKIEDLKSHQKLDFEQFRSWLYKEAERRGFLGSEEIKRRDQTAYYFSCTLSVGRDVWGCNVELEVLNDRNFGEDPSIIQTQIATSSTSRSVAQSITLLNNLRAAIDFAAVVEAYVRGRYLVPTVEKEKAKPTRAQPICQVCEGGGKVCAECSQPLDACECAGEDRPETCMRCQGSGLDDR